MFGDAFSSTLMPEKDGIIQLEKVKLWDPQSETAADASKDTWQWANHPSQDAGGVGLQDLSTSSP